MTAEIFTPNFPRKEKEKHVEGNFISRGNITVTEGTAKPSGVKRSSDNPQAGSVHRSSVKGYEHPKLDHPAYSSVHRPAPEPTDMHQLKKTQQEMLTPRQRKKNKSKG